jgi:O-succinylbenzoic acid--CoA ligase
VTEFDLAVAARDAKDTIALIAPDGTRATYAALAERVLRIARVLSESGVGSHGAIAIWAGSREATFLTILAAIELGAPLVPIHPRFTAAEALDLIRLASPTRTYLEDDLDDLMVRAARVSPLASPTSRGRAHDPASPLAVLFTSGTTGRPKGATLSRGAFIASAEASATNLPWEEKDRWLCAMPLCHVGGLSIVTRCLAARRGIVLHTGFEPDAVLASIVNDGTTLLSVVPTMLHRLLEADAGNVLSRTRAILVGGAACSSDLLRECARRNVLALTTYGLTEACSQVTTQRPRSRRATEPGSGHPLPGTEIRIVDGRIEFRGPTMMTGYLREPPLERGAWFPTGDIGEIDAEGRLFVHARRTDLIVTGGENVYPAEIEMALESCPGVRRALVFGVPDAQWGEVVACAIERTADGVGSEGEIVASLSKVMASHKMPRRVCMVDALPVVGEKVDRVRGKEMCAARVRPWQR